MKTFAFFVLFSAPVLAQMVPPCSSVSPEAAKSQFDAVTLKPAGPFVPGPNPFAARGGPGTDDPGRLSMARAALSNLILRAYGLDVDQLKGPAWLSDSMNNGFAVVATMPVSTTQEQFCGMLQNMLTERFHIAFHLEKQSRPGYELTVLPGGPKFKGFVPEANADTAPVRGTDDRGFPRLSPGQPTAASFSFNRTGLRRVSFRNNMTVFARSLAANIVESNGMQLSAGTPLPRVVDKTGLAGVYDIRYEFAGTPIMEPGGTQSAPDLGDVGQSIFTAVQQQLGLKLTKAADVQIDVMIIDHIDQKPTEN
ncbi:MAG TPA: TIGR03435 family protein [Bryobacteraceae bacterium]|nr:TIGR03435 family protein [Bryobacteraceae bacterium]